MKKYRYLLVITFLMLNKISYCDVIEIGSHAVIKCIKITNVEDYPEISLIRFNTSLMTDGSNYSSYVIVSPECLEDHYGKGWFYLFAVNKTYLQGKDIEKIDWENDENAVRTNIQLNTMRDVVNDSNPISSIEQFYKILGFTDSSVVLFKWKEVENDINGKVLSDNEFTYDGDISKLSQQIPLGINSNQYSSTFTLFPNPAQQVVSLKISNFYEGTVPVEIISFGGKILKSIALNKSGFIHDSTIPIENLPKGIYFVTIRFGAMVETQKLIIN